MRVFIVDDSEGIVKLLTTYLTKKGHEVVGHAYTGEEAMNKLERYDYDLLIIDVFLGDANGYDIARKISKSKNVAILVITSDDSFECDEFPVLKKPFPWAEFDKYIDMPHKLAF